MADDPDESFRRYQGLIQREYEAMIGEFGLVRMDATDNLIRQQHEMRQLVRPHLDGVVRIDEAGVRDALRETGLIGRYLVGRAASGGGRA